MALKTIVLANDLIIEAENPVGRLIYFFGDSSEISRYISAEDDDISIDFLHGEAVWPIAFLQFQPQVNQ